MANTFTAIATTTVGSGGAAGIDFTGIPDTYTDLCVMLSSRDSGAGATSRSIVLRFNNDSGTNYSQRLLQGDGSAASSASGSGDSSIVWGVSTAPNATANTFSNCQFYIPNYTSSNNKSVSMDSVSENNATSALQRLTAALWANSAAINRVTINAEATFVQYTTATLYGIKN